MQEPQVQASSVQEPQVRLTGVLEPIQESGEELNAQEPNFQESNVVVLELVFDPGLRPSIYSVARDSKGLENIRRANLLKGPSQPKVHAFKKIELCGRDRKFNPKLYKKYVN